METIRGEIQKPVAIFVPLELQYIILHHVFSNYHGSNAAYRFTAPGDVLTTFLVCRAWYAYARKLFYREIYFCKPLMYYRFATSLLQGLPKGMGKDVGRLVRKVIFDVPREENVHRGVFPHKPRFASISRAIEAILRCCPLITWIEIRGCFPGGPETDIVTRVTRDHSKALRISYNTNVGLVLRQYRPQKYNDPAKFPYGTRVSLQKAPGSFQNAAPFSMLDFNTQNLQRLDLSLELSSARCVKSDKQRDYAFCTAVSLSKVVICILNIEVYFRNWYHDDTLAVENLFGLIASNLHLKRLEIVSLHIPPRCTYWPLTLRPSKAFQGLAATELAEGHLKTWIESDPTGRLRKIVKLGRKVVDTVFPTSPTGFYQGMVMPPYNLCRVWYDRFTRQYKKAGNLERFSLSEHEEREVAAQLERYKFLYLQ
ncbi:hypothetical protein BGX38DRAFT_1216481 [Terfezia claveryi]|nr:hypothetical protein BGX38DRAFT_1216481 [Terfezia claveryi]